MLNVVDVCTRLRTFGYDVIDDDVITVDYLCRKVEQDINTYCNIEEPPEELRFRATDAVCGEFLQQKLIKGDLPSIEKVLRSVSSIKEGDTQVTFGGNQTYEQLLAAKLAALELRTSDLNRFRRFPW